MASPGARVRARSDLAWPLGIVTVAAMARLAMAALMPIVPDEAYYWDWSRHLATGYFDHPPLIALLIRAGTAIAGHTRIGVRCVVIAVGYVATVAAVLLARRLGGAGAALRAALVVAALPLAGAGLVLATPNVPLLAGLALGLLALDFALDTSSPAWWAATGILLGLALDAKYTAALLGAAVGVALLARSDLRAELRRPGPWVAVALAASVFLPVVLWNSGHDWVSFRFQLSHGLAPKGKSGPLTRELNLLGGQVGLVSPILFVALVLAVARGLGRRTPSRVFMVAAVAALVTAFFAWSALRRSVEPNWLAPAVLSAAIVWAAWPRRDKMARWEWAGLALGGLMVLTIYAQVVAPFLPVSARRDPTAQGAGWTGLAWELSAARGGGSAWIAANRYQDAAELAFHLHDHPTVFSLNIGGRPNQYDLWPRFPDRARVGDTLLVVLNDERSTPDAIVRLLPHCTSMLRGETVELRRGGELLGDRRVWTCAGWRGSWPVPAPAANTSSTPTAVINAAY